MAGKPAKQPIIIGGATFWECGCCKKPKRGSEFNLDNARANGLRPTCKSCNKLMTHCRKLVVEEMNRRLNKAA